jgi:integrase
VEKQLTAIKIKNAGDGKLQDGGGLILNKRGNGGKWIYRYSHLGKRREMGLGPWPAVSLAEARKVRDAWAAVLASGQDPISVRNAEKEAARLERDKHDPTFEELTQIVFEARKAGMRGDGTRGRWLSPLNLHVLPKIGRRRVSTLHQTDIRDTLKPIWRTKYPTAEKAIQRIKIVLRDGRLMGFDTDPMMADAAQLMLGEVRHKVTPIAATPWQEIPDLYQRLDPETISGACLRFMILTLVRAAGCRGARLSELDGNVWTVPEDRMKGNEGKAAEFRVPLSGPALEFFGAAEKFSSDLLFPGVRGFSPVSDRALELYLDRLGETGRPHGFRTSFRTWVQDTDACGFEVAETVLAHTIGGKVERTYARSDLLERRALVMDAWARFVTGQEQNVVSING